MRARLRGQEELIDDLARRRTPSLRQSADADPNIGARLLDIRRERRLSLQDLSRLTGVSASACSKLERNELSPTISTLQRIAQGLGVELVTLLSGSETAAAAASGRRSVTRAGKGSGHSSLTCDNALLCSDLKDKLVVPIVTRVRAKSTNEYQAWAKSDADIFLMVLEGTLVVHSAIYEPLVLNEGDSLYYGADTEHVWTSSGPTDAKVFWIIASKE